MAYCILEMKLRSNFQLGPVL